MEVQVRCISAGADTREAIHQMDDAFGPVFSRLVSRTATFSGFKDLAIFLSIMHPAAQLPPDKARGSYDKASATYMTSCRLDYADWVQPDWRLRTLGYARTVKAAIARIAKTRISNAEREMLVECADKAAMEVMNAAPEAVAPLLPIYLGYSDGWCTPSVHFGPVLGLNDFMLEGIRYVEVKPEDAFSIVASMPEREEALPSIPRMFRRDEEGMHFYEAFPYNDSIVEREGLCGVGGEALFHSYETLKEANKIVDRLKAEAKSKGYRSIPSSKQKRLIVEYPVTADFANANELDTRGELEDYLDDLLGRLGLGYCDGGSSGMGTMEVCCFVADFKLAKTAIEPLLAASPFKHYRRIYLEA